MVLALAVLDLLCAALPAPELQVRIDLYSKSFKVCKVLDLSENALGEKGIRRLEKYLKAFSKLEEINFYNNGLSELSLVLLVEMLPKESLKKLHFHNNMSGNGGAEAVAGLIPALIKLEVSVLKAIFLFSGSKDFRMSSCRVSVSGGVKLLESMMHKDTLRSLCLQDSTLKKVLSILLKVPSHL